MQADGLLRKYVFGGISQLDSVISPGEFGEATSLIIVNAITTQCILRLTQVPSPVIFTRTTEFSVNEGSFSTK